MRVPRRTIDRIRESIRLREYDFTAHAMEEMAEDNLDILDVEHAILTGQIARIERNDPRGIRYFVQGMARGTETLVGVVGRFATARRYLVITVYAIDEE